MWVQFLQGTELSGLIRNYSKSVRFFILVFRDTYLQKFQVYQQVIESPFLHNLSLIHYKNGVAVFKVVNRCAMEIIVMFRFVFSASIEC